MNWQRDDAENFDRLKDITFDKWLTAIIYLEERLAQSLCVYTHEVQR